MRPDGGGLTNRVNPEASPNNTKVRLHARGCSQRAWAHCLVRLACTGTMAGGARGRVSCEVYGVFW